jgi:hypothetical protein
VRAHIDAAHRAPAASTCSSLARRWRTSPA